MRILFTSTAGLGHVHPLFPLMHAARAAGDDVLVAIPGDGEAAVRNLGFDTVVTSEPSPQEAGAFWAGLDSHPEPNTYVVDDRGRRVSACGAAGRAPRLRRTCGRSASRHARPRCSILWLRG